MPISTPYVPREISRLTIAPLNAHARLAHHVSMKLSLCCLFLLIETAFLLLAGATPRAAVNQQRAPNSVDDLINIEKSLKQGLNSALRATVCLELSQGSGSGVIVSADGLILTAAHVTGGVGRQLTVILHDGKKLNCESLGLDSESDCAMVKITTPGTYPFVAIEREDHTQLGDWVYALGHSGGYNAARGAGVRLGRIVRLADRTWQSDCTLIGGDSGGPLFDLNGELIGIHSRVGANLQQNMHVPIREFLRQWDALQSGSFIGDGPFAEKPQKGSGFLGVATQETSDGQLNITKIGRESAAEKAGLRVGDQIQQIDGHAITSKAAMQDYLSEKAADDRISLLLRRDGKPLSIELRLGKK